MGMNRGTFQLLNVRQAASKHESVARRKVEVVTGNQWNYISLASFGFVDKACPKLNFIAIES